MARAFNVKLYAYKKGIKELEKEIKKLEKQKGRLSVELLNMTDDNSTVRARANKRAKLSSIGEELLYKYKDKNDLQSLIDNKEWLNV